MPRSRDHTLQQFEDDFQAQVITDWSTLREEAEELEFKLRTRSVRYGTRALNVFQRPYVFNRTGFEKLSNFALGVHEVFTKVAHRFYRDPEVRRLFDVDPRLEPYLAIDPGYGDDLPTVRLDAFPRNGTFSVNEYNSYCIGGMYANHVLNELFGNSRLIESLRARFNIEPFPILSTLASTFDSAWERSGRRDRKPSIAVVHFEDSSAAQGFRKTAEVLQQLGYQARYVDPRHLVYHRGRLYAEDLAVDVAYLAVFFEELIEREADVTDLLRAYRDRAVVPVSSLRSVPFSEKSCFAWITDPTKTPFFTAEMRRFVEAHFPWTRVLEEGWSERDGRRIDLLKYTVEEQRALVLKPSNGFGGKDVLIGDETPREHWIAMIERIVRDGLRFVVQERIPIIELPFPLFELESAEFQHRKLNLGIYVLGGVVAGLLVRVSDASVINVASGGGLAPAFRVARRFRPIDDDEKTDIDGKD